MPKRINKEIQNNVDVDDDLSQLADSASSCYGLIQPDLTHLNVEQLDKIIAFAKEQKKAKTQKDSDVVSMITKIENRVYNLCLAFTQMHRELSNEQIAKVKEAVRSKLDFQEDKVVITDYMLSDDDLKSEKQKSKQSNIKSHM